MFVKVTKATANNWYTVGEVVEVRNYVSKYKGADLFLAINTFDVGVDIADCIVMGTPDFTIEEIEAQLEVLKTEIAARKVEEAKKPFTQGRYEGVVNNVRACAGRCGANVVGRWYLEICDGNLCVDITDCYAWGLFQVYFKTREDATNAINSVGERNIIRAVEWEQGL